MARSSDSELQERVAHLEHENESLRRRVADLSESSLGDSNVDAASGEGTTSKPKWRTRSKWRTALAALLVILGAIIAPLAVVASWANVQLTDTERFVAAYAPLAEDPAIQRTVIEQTIAVIDEQIDVNRLTSDVIDGVIDLGTAPAATRALELLKGPAAQGVHSIIAQSVERMVTSDAFADVWASTLRVSHTQLIGALQNSGESALVLGSDGTIGIQLQPIIGAVKASLVGEGIAIADLIPEVDRTIAIAQSDAIPQVRLAYSLTTAAGQWLPWIALLLLSAGVLVARRPAVSLIVTAVTLSASMVVTLVAFQVSRAMVVMGTAQFQISPEAGEALFDSFTVSMRDTLTAVAITAFAIGVAGWLAGPFALPGRMRAVAKAGASRARNGLGKYGVHAGAAGEWLYRQRSICRGAIGVVAAAIILFVRPISAPLTIWTLLGAGAALLVLEIMYRPGEAADIESTPVEPAARE